MIDHAWAGRSSMRMGSGIDKLLGLPFSLVDVFGIDAFSGNPLAVIGNADGLSSEEMQRIARWLNLSETTFLLEPVNRGADYRVRIFTPDGELPFAGHPTLGSCHTWIEGGGQPARRGIVVQDCAAGLIDVRVDDAGFAFAAPPLVRQGDPTEAELAEVVGALGIERGSVVDAQWVDNGPGWLAVMLGSAEEVLRVIPARTHPRKIDIGIVGPHSSGTVAAFEIRGIFTNRNGVMVEDPATGSLNASVGQWLFASGRANRRYFAAQGACLGRTGFIEVSQDDSGTVWVGRNTQTLFKGKSGFVPVGRTRA